MRTDRLDLFGSSLQDLHRIAGGGIITLGELFGLFGHGLPEVVLQFLLALELVILVLDDPIHTDLHLFFYRLLEVFEQFVQFVLGF